MRVFKIMIVDGKKIAQDIISELKRVIKKLERSPKLFVVLVGQNNVTARYVSLKQKIAKKIGINVEIARFKESVTTETLIQAIKAAADTVDGIIVQLPLPSHIDKQAVLNTVPIELDVDVLGNASNEKFQKGTNTILPPVIASINEILIRGNVNVNGKRAVVVGKGALVGRPAAVWLTNQGADVVSLDSKSENFVEEIQKADIIVTGAGVPNLIKPDMIKYGVVLLDAATSELEGSLVGDTSSACSAKASLYSPVPGGIGPITIATLLNNLVLLSK